ncbi:MAG: F0F1 ATP synthase subunit B [Candidatus Binatia bacterium]
MRLFGILFLAEALAAPSAGVEGHTASATQVIFPLINFLIFLYLVKRFLFPFIREHLRSRREEILAALKEADEGRERAEALGRDYRGRLERLDEETKEIREALRTEGERERAKLLAEAEDFATKIKADADFIAEQEVKMARGQVREEMARIAQAAAERVVQSHLTSAGQRRLVEEFVHEVEQVR